eukprot:m.24462 g.24462  ORF g.24462 m.24462 type:complete len:81 (-) comp11511_c0_seq1:94-336(-)
MEASLLQLLTSKLRMDCGTVVLTVLPSTKIMAVASIPYDPHGTIEVDDDLIAALDRLIESTSCADNPAMTDGARSTLRHH